MLPEKGSSTPSKLNLATVNVNFVGCIYCKILHRWHEQESIGVNRRMTSGAPGDPLYLEERYLLDGVEGSYCVHGLECRSLSLPHGPGVFGHEA